MIKCLILDLDEFTTIEKDSDFHYESTPIHKLKELYSNGTGSGNGFGFGSGSKSGRDCFVVEKFSPQEALPTMVAARVMDLVLDLEAEADGELVLTIYK
jgi:hypothetical protein